MRTLARLIATLAIVSLPSLALSTPLSKRAVKGTDGVRIVKVTSGTFERPILGSLTETMGEGGVMGWHQFDKGNIRVKGSPAATAKFVSQLSARHPKALIRVAPVKQFFGLLPKKGESDISFNDVAPGKGPMLLKTASQLAGK